MEGEERREGHDRRVRGISRNKMMRVQKDEEGESEGVQHDTLNTDGGGLKGGRLEKRRGQEEKSDSCYPGDDDENTK